MKVGYAVAQDGAYQAAGAPGDGANRGAVYVREKSASVSQAKGFVVEPDTSSGDLFGSAVDLAWPLLAVGAPGSGSDGAAWLYEYSADTETWVKMGNRINSASVGVAIESLGTSTSVSEGMMLVGGAGAAVLQVITIQGTPAPDDECGLPFEWSQLRPDARAGLLRTGGLGLNARNDSHTWLCHFAHHCARRRRPEPANGSGLASAMSAKECFDGCQAGGYACDQGAELRDHYWGCCNTLSCMQTCMMRVSGLSFSDCTAQVSITATPGSECEFTVAGRRYNVCRTFEASACQVEPTVQGGLYGCEIGSLPNASAIDPYCWIYKEGHGFESFGRGSEVGLLWDAASGGFMGGDSAGGISGGGGSYAYGSATGSGDSDDGSYYYDSGNWSGGSISGDGGDGGSYAHGSATGSGGSISEDSAGGDGAGSGSYSI